VADQLLAVYDPSGKLGLTAPSPGGGRLANVYRCSCGTWGHSGCSYFGPSLPVALLLRTADGTPDPVGMARAREVLARVEGLDVGDGVTFRKAKEGPDLAGGWLLGVGTVVGTIQFCRRGGVPARGGFAPRHPVCPGPEDESAPEALARLLSERAGCEVIRG